jgi:type I restriction enzyme S subunit
MSRIEQLIAELCPDGVEYKELGEVCEFQRGQIITKKNTIEGDIPVIAGGQNPAYYHNSSNRTGQTIAVSGSGAYAGFVSFWEIPIFLSDAFSVNPLKELLLTKYVYHFLKHNQVKIYGTQKGSGVPHLHGSSIAKFPIPIPPLPIQQEIVRILDTFTELDAELQAELEARKKQYEHYRNQLLNFEGKEVEWIPFEDCFEMKNGYTPSKSKSEYWNNGTIPWFRMEDIRGNGKILSNSIQKINQEAIKGGKLFPANSIIIATSATIGEHALITTEYLSNQRFTCYYPKKAYKEKVNMKYMYYYSYLLSEWCKNNTNVSGFASVDMTRFRKLQIPLPPVSEQERIVSILDKFEALVNEELSAEIDARRKQYEYYREKLLAFEPLVS